MSSQETTDIVRWDRGIARLEPPPDNIWRVDVGGVPISVRGEAARQHLDEFNRDHAKLKLILTRYRRALEIIAGGDGDLRVIAQQEIDRG